MFPGRFWTALGSGEASNEHITGERWPPQGGADPAPRGVRRRDPAPPRRRGGHPRRPRHRRPGPAVGPAAGAAAAHRPRGVRRVRRAGGRLGRRARHDQPAGRRAARHRVGLPRRGRPRPARRSRSTCRGRRPARRPRPSRFDQWRTNVFTEPVNWDTETPEAFDVMAEHVDIEAVRRSVEVSHDLSWHRDRIAELAAVGFDDVYLHFVGQEQAGFLDAFGDRGASRPQGLTPRRRRLLVWVRASHRHERPVVEERGHLLPRHRDLLRLRRRRHRRPGRPGRSASTTSPSSASPACG